MNRVKLISILISLLFWGMSPGFDDPRMVTAGTEPTGKVAGVVLDANEGRIADATVMIRNGATRYKLRTSDEGEFQVALPAGDYQITVEADGFRKFSHCSLTVKAAETKRVSVQLKVAVPPGLVPAASKDLLRMHPSKNAAVKS